MRAARAAPSDSAASLRVRAEDLRAYLGPFVDPAARPEATLDQLGLDSLALMEFVFAVEDRFEVRIPEDRLDPRQAGVTLAHLAQLLDDAVAAKPPRDAAAA